MKARRISSVIRHWSLVMGHLLILGHWTYGADVAGPLSPADARKAFQLADGSLRIELAAAEPDVVDPVAIRFDEDGRMWVVEMRDYPLGNPTGGEPLSRIRVLETAMATADSNRRRRLPTSCSSSPACSLRKGACL